MIRSEYTTDIDRPVREVFSFLVDFTTLPRYDRYVQSAERTSSGQIGVGSTWTHTRVQGRRHIVAPITLLEYEADRRFVMQSGSQGFDVRSTVAVEPLGGDGTRIVEVLEMRLSGFVRLFEPMIARQVPKQGREVHEALKRVLESAAV